MAWNVEFIDTARRQLARLDRKWQAVILDYLEYEIAPLADPRSRGKPLVGDRKGLWRYRVGDYRILCELTGQPPGRPRGDHRASARGLSEALAVLHRNAWRRTRGNGVATAAVSRPPVLR